MAVVCGVTLYGGYAALLWQPLVREAAQGHALESSLKDSYLGDQLAYLAIARNVQDGKPANVEPFTATGRSIYPSGYYWMLGRFAALTDTNPIFAWNAIGLAATLALALLSGAWMAWSTLTLPAIVLGPVPLLVGTLMWLRNGSWRASYGDHAVLWPGYAILFNPNAETPGVALAIGASVCTAIALRDRTRSWFVMVGVLVGLNAHVHTYTTIFSATVFAASLLAFVVLTKRNRRVVEASAGVIVTGFLIAMSDVAGSQVGRLVIAMVALAAPALLFGDSKLRRGIVAAAVGAIAVSLPMLVAIVRDARSENSFFSFRQTIVRGLDLSLPLQDVVISTAPLLALAVVAIINLGARRVEDTRAQAWAAVLVGALVGGATLTFNQAWGVNQEPYRFYPYWSLLLAVLAMPWLLRRGVVRRSLPVMCVIVAALLATVPTTWLWSKDHVDQRVRFSEGERVAFAEVARAVSKSGGLVLFDTCIPRRVFKVMTGTDVADYVPGLAVPDAVRALHDVMESQWEGSFPSGAEMRAAGINSFVTANYCLTVDKVDLEARFGPAIAAIRPRDPVRCGMPVDTVYEVYDVRRDQSAERIRIEGAQAGIPNQFRDGMSALVSKDACGYWFSTPLPIFRSS